MPRNSSSVEFFGEIIAWGYRDYGYFFEDVPTGLVRTETHFCSGVPSPFAVPYHVCDTWQHVFGTPETCGGFFPQPRPPVLHFSFVNHMDRWKNNFKILNFHKFCIWVLLLIGPEKWAVKITKLIANGWEFLDIEAKVNSWKIAITNQRGQVIDRKGVLVLLLILGSLLKARLREVSHLFFPS